MSIRKINKNTDLNSEWELIKEYFDVKKLSYGGQQNVQAIFYRGALATLELKARGWTFTEILEQIEDFQKSHEQKFIRFINTN